MNLKHNLEIHSKLDAQDMKVIYENLRSAQLENWPLLSDIVLHTPDNHHKPYRYKLLDG
jgi:hypothetical protein